MKSQYPTTITQTRKHLKEGDFSIRDLVSYFLDRIQKYDRKLNSIITVNPDALKTAERLDDEYSKDKDIFDKKKLFGIPYIAKDLYLTKNLRTTAGSKVLECYIPQYDASIIKKLQQAGAILLAKANCDAWAHGASGENSDFGPTRNPWDLTRVPGGSSSGSAASLASSFCMFSMGTDTGGSIRQPASFCNLTGIKPTYGLVSRYGIISMASSLDTMGHFTRNVEDSAEVLDITSGYDAFDATSSDRTSKSFVKSLRVPQKKLIIGIPKEYFSKGIDSKITARVREAIKIFETEGYGIEEVSLPLTEYSLAVYYIIQPAEVSSNLSRYDGIRYGNKRSSFGGEAVRRIMLGTYTLSAGYYDAYYLKAQKVRNLIMQDFDHVFEKVDVLMAPVSPTLPFKIGEKVSDPLAMYMSDILTVTANIAGLPALSIPCGFAQEDGKKLPVGFQIIGRQFSEENLYNLGHFYQTKTAWHKEEPQV